MGIFSYLRRMDWTLVGCTGFLMCVSLVAIASAKPDELFQQSVASAIGIALMLVFAFIDWRPLIAHRSIIFSIYGAGIALLIATYFFAPTIRATRSWLVFGPVQFQTSEFMKVVLIILYSYYFARRHTAIAEWRNILIPFFYAALPVGLILLQPDMGSGLIIMGLWVIYLFVSGLRLRHVLLGLGVAVVIAFLGWNHLQGYQRERIKGLFNPQYDPLGVNYNVIQSKIAIGSGGWLGKGFRQGTQTQLGFLPEPANDFVFSSIAEEWGAAGVFALLLAFALLIGRLLYIGLALEGNFGKLVCLGTAGLILLHMAFNIGSAVGFMPVVGVPLPLVSYGGSSLLTFFMALGIVQSAAIRSSF
jgi:rod shape determining protein RodA